MTNVLDEICAKKREHVFGMKTRRPLSAVLDDVQTVPPTRGFQASLRAAVRRGGYGLVGEIKRSSPSGGLIRADFNPASLARAYEAGGATCLSVLTDAPYFSGANDHLSAARAVIELPVLRKDFIIDPYQVVESRAIGADCILLIMAALDDSFAHDLDALAAAHGMDVLVEVHDEHEMERALKLSSSLIGINNRDLKTLKTDIAATLRLAPMVPDDRLVISESGLATADDLARMADSGVKCFLIGEALMRQADVEAAVVKILTPPRGRRANA